MSAETTPAVERGAAALNPAAFGPTYEEMARQMGVSESGADWSRDMARKRSRDVLAAALDVEEMARVMSEHPDVWASASGWKCAGCSRLVQGRVRSELREAAKQRHQAAAIRAALLGADS